MQGFVLSDEFSAGRVAGDIQVHFNSLSFKSEEVQFEWSLSSTSIQKGGAANRLYMMTNPLSNGYTLCTAESGLLKQVKNVTQLHPSWLALQKKRSKTPWILLALLLLIGGFFYGLYLLKDPVVKAIAGTIPTSWEENLSKTQLEAMKLNQGFSQDTILLNQIKQIAAPILKSAQSQKDWRNYQYQFYVANNPQVNAFAMPGGIVVINAGLIQKADRIEEIQGVLAHEIAHAEKQHGMRNVLSSLGLFALVSTITGGMDGITAVLLEQGAQLTTLKFSRDFEREADEVGFGYLVQQQIDPQGMLTFFQKLMAEPKGKIHEVMENVDFLSTHPATSERIDRLGSLIKSQKPLAWQKSTVDLNQLKSRLRSAEAKP